MHKDEGIRLGIASRFLAATAGAYALASAASLALARHLPVKPSDAVAVAEMLGFILFAVAAIWAFATRSALRAWIGIAIVLLPFALFLLLPVSGPAQ